MFFPPMLSKVKSSLPDLTNTPVLSANTTLDARQRNCGRSALHIGGVVNNRVEPSALVYRHPFYRERHVQLRFKRSCYAFAKFDCVTGWTSLSVFVRERPGICPIGNAKRCGLVNDL